MSKRMCPYCNHVAPLSSFPLVDGAEDTVWCHNCETDIILKDLVELHSYQVSYTTTHTVQVYAQNGNKAIIRAQNTPKKYWQEDVSDLICTPCVR